MFSPHPLQNSFSVPLRRMDRQNMGFVGLLGFGGIELAGEVRFSPHPLSLGDSELVQRSPM